MLDRVVEIVSNACNNNFSCVKLLKPALLRKYSTAISALEQILKQKSTPKAVVRRLSHVVIGRHDTRQFAAFISPRMLPADPGPAKGP